MVKWIHFLFWNEGIRFFQDEIKAIFSVIKENTDDVKKSFSPDPQGWCQQNMVQSILGLRNSSSLKWRITFFFLSGDYNDIVKMFWRTNKYSSPDALGESTKHLRVKGNQVYSKEGPIPSKKRLLTNVLLLLLLCSNLFIAMKCCTD